MNFKKRLRAEFGEEWGASPHSSYKILEWSLIHSNGTYTYRELASLLNSQKGECRAPVTAARLRVANSLLKGELGFIRMVRDRHLIFNKKTTLKKCRFWFHNGGK